MRASLTEQRMFLSAAAACSVLSRQVLVFIVTHRVQTNHNNDARPAVSAGEEGIKHGDVIAADDQTNRDKHFDWTAAC